MKTASHVTSLYTDIIIC